LTPIPSFPEAFSWPVARDLNSSPPSVIESGEHYLFYNVSILLIADKPQRSEARPAKIARYEAEQVEGGFYPIC
jgi:hypothetical protein